MGTRYNGRRRRRGKRLPAPVKGAKKSARKSSSVWTHLGIAVAFWTIVSTLGYVLWTCRGAAIGI